MAADRGVQLGRQHASDLLRAPTLTQWRRDAHDTLAVPAADQACVKLLQRARSGSHLPLHAYAAAAAAVPALGSLLALRLALCSPGCPPSLCVCAVRTCRGCVG
jgi:hypothetical protein